ncbi:MAG: hypothetical protein HPY85_15200 [Anaerolineae bacterium]|nr:hypothetical protein [Anaerolineae bacterium]
MKEWIQNLVDDPERRASFSILAGGLSLLAGIATFLFIMAYPVSVVFAIFGILLAYPSLDSRRPWQALIGLALSGLGLLLPPGALMYALFLAR